MALVKIKPAQLEVSWLPAYQRMDMASTSPSAPGASEAGKRIWSLTFDDWLIRPVSTHGSNVLIYTDDRTDYLGTDDPASAMHAYAISDGRKDPDFRATVAANYVNQVLKPASFYCEWTRRVLESNPATVQADYGDQSVNEPAYQAGVRAILQTTSHSRLREHGNNQFVEDSSQLAIYSQMGEEEIVIYLPWSIIKPIWEAERTKAMSAYMESLKYEAQEPPEYDEWAEYTRADNMIYQFKAKEYGYKFNATHRNFTLEIPLTDVAGTPLVYNTAAKTVGAYDGTSELFESYDDYARAAMATYDLDQAVQLKLAPRGLANKFSAPRPLATTDPKLTIRDECDAWWADKERIWQSIFDINAANASTGLDEFTDAKEKGTTTAEDLAAFAREQVAAEAAVAKADPKGWLPTLWDSLKGVAGYVGDVVKDWGPTSIIGAWAGYEAVKSAKSSSIPSWLIIGGVGLLALMIVK